jgi:hypothetical protein
MKDKTEFAWETRMTIFVIFTVLLFLHGLITPFIAAFFVLTSHGLKILFTKKSRLLDDTKRYQRALDIVFKHEKKHNII